jgi:hypothetical protein
MAVPETREGDHPEPSKRNYLLNTDGSGTGTIDNPAQGAIGVVLKDPDGHLIAEIAERIGLAINMLRNTGLSLKVSSSPAVAASNASGCSLTRSS